MKFFLILASGAFFLAPHVSAQSKTITANADSCDFYLDLEKKMGCGKTTDSYLTSYGYKYCSRFLRERINWNGALKTWATDTALCLQEMLIENPKRTKPCEQLTEFAFDSHPICYKQYRFCKLSSEDQAKIRGIVSALDIAGSVRRSATQAMNTYLSCWFASAGNEATATNLAIASSYQLNDSERIALADAIGAAPSDAKQRQAYFGRFASFMLFGKSTAETERTVRELSDTQGGKPPFLQQSSACWASSKKDCEDINEQLMTHIPNDYRKAVRIEPSRDRVLKAIEAVQKK